MSNFNPVNWRIVWQEGDPITVTQIVKTCGAVPAQWQGKTSTGDWMYIRYRFGWFRIDLWADSTGDCDEITIFSDESGDDFDGYMEYDELKQRVPDWITLPEVEG